MSYRDKLRSNELVYRSDGQPGAKRECTKEYLSDKILRNPSHRMDNYIALGYDVCRRLQAFVHFQFKGASTLGL